jgi:hypothetical protein
VSAKGLAASMNMSADAVQRRLDNRVGLGLLKRIKPGGMVRGTPYWKWIGPVIIEGQNPSGGE